MILNTVIDALLKILMAAPALLGMGLMMGFSPALYSITFLALINDFPRIHIVRWIVLGIFLGASTLILLFRFVDPQNLIGTVHTEGAKLLLTHSIDIFAGVVLLLAGVVMWSRRKLPQRPHRVKGSHLYPRKAVLEGYLNSSIGVSSVATMYLAGRLVSSVSHSPVEWICAYAIFVVSMVGPYLLIEASWNKYPRFAHVMADGFHRLKTANLRGLYGVLLGAAGCVFLGLSLRGFLA